MMECTDCKAWFHPACVGTTQQDAPDFHLTCFIHNTKAAVRPADSPLGNSKVDRLEGVEQLVSSDFLGLNKDNKAWSPDCNHCDQTHTPVRYRRQNGAFVTLCVECAGDLPWIHKMLGMKGGNCTWFCPFCDVCLDEKPKGRPHGNGCQFTAAQQAIWDEHVSQVRDNIARGEKVLPLRRDFNPRSVAGCRGNYEKLAQERKDFTGTKEKRSKLAGLHSQQHPPCLPDSFDIQTELGRMVLHLSLGIILKFVDMVQSYVKEMDILAKSLYLEVKPGLEEKKAFVPFDGGVEDEPDELGVEEVAFESVSHLAVDEPRVQSLDLYNNLTKARAAREMVSKEVEELDAKILEWEIGLKTIEDIDDGKVWQKVGKQYTSNTPTHVGIRNHLELMRKKALTEKMGAQKQRKSLMLTLKKSADQMDRVTAILDQHKGPFERRMDSYLKKIGASRNVYHSGSFTGPDIDKIVKSHDKLFEDIQPLILTSAIDGKSVMVGDPVRLRNFSLLFNQSASIYAIRTANRPLCAHEVSLLTKRCRQFGIFYPTTFPAETITPKMHFELCHVHEYAELMASRGYGPGRQTEQVHQRDNTLAHV